MNKLKRNTLAVRLNDRDYDKFLELAGDSYSLTLRELIVFFNQNAPTDQGLTPKQKVQNAIDRCPTRS